MKTPRCVIIAGPNGAGKTTFATDFLPRERAISHFINADLIAAGLSPLAPSLAQIAAGRLFLREMDRFAAAREDFGFESTLSGKTYLARITQWKQWGYRIEIVFLRLPSPGLAKARVAARVRQGGHDVSAADILRRYRRGWENFQRCYAGLADTWSVYDNSAVPTRLIGRFP
jgi:predicted ABC-type ATPase